MPSPFPGMDPYLEAHWGDVHTSIATYARNQLQPQLPPDLRARVEEHLAVEVEGEKSRGYFPDVRIIERWPTRRLAPADAPDIALAEPLIVPMEAVEPETLRSVVIVDRQSGNRIVTAIEILSPANKRTAAGRQAYRKKQSDLREGGVNLVEIDLLRSGKYVLAVPKHSLPQPYLAPYRICVVRGSHPEQAEVYRASFRERLPVIRIPLRETDSDVALDLQSLIDQAYEHGDYEDIDYSAEPIPPLAPGDAAWADALLREKGRR